MNRRTICALASAISSCMPVHEVTLGADAPRIVLVDAGGVDEPAPADATVSLPASLDAGAADAAHLDTTASLDAMADAARSDANPHDAAADSAAADAARSDAGGKTNAADGGDAGKPHDDDDLHFP